MGERQHLIRLMQEKHSPKTTVWRTGKNSRKFLQKVETKFLGFGCPYHSLESIQVGHSASEEEA